MISRPSRIEAVRPLMTEAAPRGAVSISGLRWLARQAILPLNPE
jgi:hypothetical protein